MKFVYVNDYENAKSASDVLTCLARNGHDIDHWHSQIYEVPVFDGWTKKELREHLCEVVWHYNDAQPHLKLKVKECKIVDGWLSELDSTNLSHANAYYTFVIRLPKRVVSDTNDEWFSRIRNARVAGMASSISNLD